MQRTNVDMRSCFADPAGQTVSAPWTIRTLRGGTVGADAIAAASGLRIFSIVSASCFLLGLSVIWRGDVSTTAAGFWPAAGGALVAMLVVPVRRWGWVIAGIVTPTVAALALGMMTLGPAIWWAAANVIEPALGAAIVLRVGRTRRTRRGGFALVFLLGAVVFAPLVGATIGSVGTIRAYDRSWENTWLEWFVGDALGVLVMVPLLMTFTSRRGARRTNRERVALGVTVATASALGFANLGRNGSVFVPYLILAVLLWAGMRFGQRAAASTGFVVALAANLATSKGWGPFAAADGPLEVLSLQIFLAIALVMSFAVASTVSELAGRDEVHALLTQQATHDALTGLSNRVLFADRLRDAIERHERVGCGVGLVLIDLDEFARINDRHGHPAGDRVLGLVVRQLQASLRSDNLVARIGGDEFVVLCDQVEDAEQILAIAGAVSKAIETPIEFDGFEHHICGSIGVAFALSGEVTSSADLFRRADIALYESKAKPERKITVFDDELEARTLRHIEIEAELKGAIARDELSVVYQPIVCLDTEVIVGFEALLRWTNRQLGPVGPNEFIEIAERSGLIGAIGDWVLEVACRQLAVLRAGDGVRHEPRDLHVSVNVSTRQLRDAEFPSRVLRTLQSLSLPPESLVLEITETAVMDDLDVSRQALADLREIGVKLSMDDFGTGYSSLTYLRMFPVDSLKIDRSFVADIGGTTNDIAIVRAILSLSADLNLDVIAEGIETAAQAATLRQLGCRLGQGFFYGRPEPIPDIGGRRRWGLVGMAGRAERSVPVGVGLSSPRARDGVRLAPRHMPDDRRAVSAEIRR